MDFSQRRGQRTAHVDAIRTFHRIIQSEGATSTMRLSPSPAPPSRGLRPGPPLRTLLQTTIRTTEPPDSKDGLFPIRSSLLRESLSWSPDARQAVAATAKRVELQPPLAATSVDVDSYLGQPRAQGARKASIRPATTARPMIKARCEGATRCVMPRAEISVAESRFHFQKKHRSSRRTPRTGREGQAIDSSIPWLFPRRGFDNDPPAGSPTETLLRLLLPLNDKVQWTSRDVAGSEPPTSPRSEHFTGSFNR
ncbi:hypothetical protein CQW23_35437 [Capsicum baccatum]|uniref:Protein TAR1 n=1 Tax=Capsicum baccatum TaxID=33114 RepID=A0A2G2UVY2_CAPBA|nr:hypothetical protein CQW23_35437 [Capsicum baccatum]